MHSLGENNILFNYMSYEGVERYRAHAGSVHRISFSIRAYYEWRKVFFECADISPLHEMHSRAVDIKVLKKCFWRGILSTYEMRNDFFLQVAKISSPNIHNYQLSDENSMILIF